MHPTVSLPHHAYYGTADHFSSIPRFRVHLVSKAAADHSPSRAPLYPALVAAGQALLEPDSPMSLAQSPG